MAKLGIFDYIYPDRDFDEFGSKNEYQSGVLGQITQPASEGFNLLNIDPSNLIYNNNPVSAFYSLPSEMRSSILGVEEKRQEVEAMPTAPYKGKFAIGGGEYTNQTPLISESDITDYGDAYNKQISNLDKNIAEVNLGILEMASKPEDVVQTGLNLTSGVMQNITGVEWNKEDIAMADAVAKSIVNDFGSWEGFKKALYERPVDTGGMVLGGSYLTVGGLRKLQNLADKSGFADLVDKASRQLPETKMSNRSEMFGSLVGLERTGKLDLVDKAQKMEAEGASPEQIWNTHGLIRGLDDKWRYEFDDSKMELTLDDVPKNPLNLRPLEQVIKHPTLFNTYPELRELKVAPFKYQLPERTGGVFHGDHPMHGQLIEMNPTKMDDKKTYESYLAHEIQHAIQRIEGTARGGNQRNETSLIMNTGYPAEVKRKFDEGTERVQALIPFINKASNRFEYISDSDLEDIGYPKDMDRQTAYRNASEELRQLQESNQDLYWEYASLGEKARLEGFENYKKLAGEAEAFETQDRFNLSELERQGLLPAFQNVSKEDAIVRFDDVTNLGEDVKSFKDIKEGDTITTYHASPSSEIEGGKLEIRDPIHGGSGLPKGIHSAPQIKNSLLDLTTGEFGDNIYKLETKVGGILDYNNPDPAQINRMIDSVDELFPNATDTHKEFLKDKLARGSFTPNEFNADFFKYHGIDTIKDGNERLISLDPENVSLLGKIGDDDVQKTTTTGLQDEGSVRGILGMVSQEDVIRKPEYQRYYKERETDGSLVGLPRDVGRENPAKASPIIQDQSRQYAEQKGIEYKPVNEFVEVDEEYSTKVANAFEEMEHNPRDPKVVEAYNALIDETLEQYKVMLDNGLKVEYYPKDFDPYPNPWDAIDDITNNNHLYIFPTKQGFGSDVEFDVTENPLLRDTEFRINGEIAPANDIFRAVHDYFGHAKEGVGFRASGEENAFIAHSSMYSPLAQKALATETRGQNSWLNFGKFGEKNRQAGVEDTIFADQKIGLLPDEFTNPNYLTNKSKGLLENITTKKANKSDDAYQMTYWQNDGKYGDALDSRNLPNDNEIYLGAYGRQTKDFILVDGGKNQSQKAKMRKDDYQDEEIFYTIYDKKTKKPVGTTKLVEQDVDGRRTITGLVDIKINDQNQGIGKKFINNLKQSAKADPYSVAPEFKVFDVKEDAVGFWEKVGAKDFYERGEIGGTYGIKSANAGEYTQDIPAGYKPKKVSKDHKGQINTILDFTK